MNSDEGMCIAILVVSYDLASENRVAEVLRRCDYRVLRTQTVNEALREIYEKKERLDLVITNLNKLESGVATIQIINQTFKLNVLSIPSDDQRIQQNGVAAPLSFSLYIVKGLNLNSAALKNLMGNPKGVEGAAAAAANDEQQNTININVERAVAGENVERAAALGTNVAVAAAAAAAVEAIFNKTVTVNVERAAAFQKYKAASAAENVKRAFAIGTHELSSYPSSSLIIDDASQQPQQHKGKKPRVTWTDDMHNKFLKAIETLGDEKAVPNKILELMKDFPALTRENVASHLQKHRYSNNAQKSSK